MSQYVSVCGERCPGMSVFVEKDVLVYLCLWRKTSQYITVCGERSPGMSVFVVKNVPGYQCLWRKMCQYVPICGGRWPGMSVFVEKDGQCVSRERWPDIAKMFRYLSV